MLVQQSAGYRAAATDERLGPVLGRTEARMLVTLPWLPVWLATFTVLLFVIRFGATMAIATGPDVVLVAIACGLLAWFAGGVLTNHWVLPARANPRTYSELRSRISQAEVEVAQVDRDHPGSARQLQAWVAELWQALGSQEPETGWSSGDSYDALWRKVHLIEESMIQYAADRDLPAVLLHDRLRVEGSKLARKGSLVLEQINEVQESLKPRPVPPTGQAVGGAGAPPAADAARSLLAMIRTSVNDYRDLQYASLIGARKGLDRVSTLLGLVAWAVLVLAILSGAPGTAVVSVAAFYLIGVAAGLMTQLQGNKITGSAEDKFGYGSAQLRQTMLVSGLSAVVGVVLTSIAAAGIASTGDIASLTNGLIATPGALLTAALFGLAPGTLLDRLNALANARIGDLESTLATGGAEKESSAK